MGIEELKEKLSTVEAKYEDLGNEIEALKAEMKTVKVKHWLFSDSEKTSVFKNKFIKALKEQECEGLEIVINIAQKDCGIWEKTYSDFRDLIYKESWDAMDVARNISYMDGEFHVDASFFNCYDTLVCGDSFEAVMGEKWAECVYQAFLEAQDVYNPAESMRQSYAYENVYEIKKLVDLYL